MGIGLPIRIILILACSQLGSLSSGLAQDRLPPLPPLPPLPSLPEGDDEKPSDGLPSIPPLPDLGDDSELPPLPSEETGSLPTFPPLEELPDFPELPPFPEDASYKEAREALAEKDFDRAIQHVFFILQGWGLIGGAEEYDTYRIVATAQKAKGKTLASKYNYAAMDYLMGRAEQCIETLDEIIDKLPHGQTGSIKITGIPLLFDASFLNRSRCLHLMALAHHWMGNKKQALVLLGKARKIIPEPFFGPSLTDMQITIQSLQLELELARYGNP